MKVIESPAPARAHNVRSALATAPASPHSLPAQSSHAGAETLQPPVERAHTPTKGRFDVRDAILQWLREHPHMRGVQVVTGGPFGLAQNARFRAIQAEAGREPVDERALSKAFQSLVRDAEVRSKFKLRVASGRAGSTWREMLYGPTKEIWTILHEKGPSGMRLGAEWQARTNTENAGTRHVPGVPLVHVCKRILAIRDEQGRQKYHVCPFTVRRILNDWGYKVDTSDSRPWVHPRALIGLTGTIIRDLEKHAGGQRVQNPKIRNELIEAGLVIPRGDVLYPTRRRVGAKVSAAAQRVFERMQTDYRGCTVEEIVKRLVSAEKNAGDKITAATVKDRLETFRSPDGVFALFERNPFEKERWRITGLHQEQAAFDHRLKAALLDIQKKDPALLRRKIVGPGGVLEALADRGLFWPNLSAADIRRYVKVTSTQKSPRAMSAMYRAELDKLIPEIVEKATRTSSDYPGDRCFKLTSGPRKGRSIPILRADGTVIIGSAPGESPGRFPDGNGLCGVFGQRGSPVNPSKRVVQEAVRRLGYPTPRAGSAKAERDERMKKLRRHVLAAVTTAKRVEIGDERVVRLKGRRGLMFILRSRGVSALASDVALILDQLKIPRERRGRKEVES